MANLIGYLYNPARTENNPHFCKPVSRTAGKRIRSRLETWEGAVTTTLEADGNFTVELGAKGGGGPVVCRGNVNTGEFSASRHDSFTHAGLIRKG